MSSRIVNKKFDSHGMLRNKKAVKTVAWYATGQNPRIYKSQDCAAYLLRIKMNVLFFTGKENQ